MLFDFLCCLSFVFCVFSGFFLATAAGETVEAEERTEAVPAVANTLEDAVAQVLASDNDEVTVVQEVAPSEICDQGMVLPDSSTNDLV